MQLLTQVPAVIAPEDDHGIIRIGAPVQCVNNPPHAGIHEADGGEVALHSLSPLIVFEDLGVVTLGLGHCPA